MPNQSQAKAAVGAAIVLPLPADVAGAVALADGLPATELHCTLAYLPSFDREDATSFAALRTVVVAWALGVAPMEALLSGLGRFAGDTAEGDPLYLSVDAPTLPAARQTLVEALTAAGFAVSAGHGFTPHVTLRYLAASDALPMARFEARALAFDRASIWRGELRDDVFLTPPADRLATMGGVTPRESYGPAVELSLPTENEGGPWCTLAYAVELKGYKLKGGGHAVISAQDIDDMVANFARYPKVPLVVEHADTRRDVAEVHPEWAAPHGYVVALRRGTMTRVVEGLPTTVASLEGRLDVPPVVRLAINGDPANDVPPTWPWCSITPAAGMNEETGQEVGTVLWSVSLTAHPRLADLPRLAAGKDHRPMKRNRAPKNAPVTAEQPAELGYWYDEICTRGDVLSMLRCVLDLPVAATEQQTLDALDALVKTDAAAAAKAGVEVAEVLERIREALRLPVIDTATNAPPDVVAKVREALVTLPVAASSEMSGRGPAAPHSTKEKTMKTMLELAAELKIPAATEEAAREALLNLSRDGAAVRSTLNLSADAPLAPRLAELVTATAELPKVRAELAGVQADLKARVDAETKAAAERAELELGRRVDEVCLAKGWGDEVKPALFAFGRTDRAGFDAKYPAPSTTELAQRGQDGARLGRLELNKTPLTPPSDEAPSASAAARKEIDALRDVARLAGEELTVVEAFALASRGVTPTIYAKELGVQLGA